MRLASVLALLLGLLGIGPHPPSTLLAQAPSSAWTTLFDGKSLDAFNTVGNANWKLADGIVEATSGAGFLVTKDTFANFEIKVEFWVDAGANSGVYMRCQDPAKIVDTTCYEANIFDKRPDQSGRTGAIVHILKPIAMVDTGGNGTPTRSPQRDRASP